MRLGLGGRQQQPRAIPLRRRFLQRAAQQVRRLPRGAGRQCLCGGLLEHGHGTRIVLGRGTHQVGGDPFGVCPVGQQQRGGPAVRATAIEVAHLRRQRRRDHRVGERQRLTRADDPGDRERVRGGLSRPALEPGKLRDMAQGRTVAEHDERPRQLRCIATQPPQPHQDRAQDARRCEPVDLLRGTRRLARRRAC